MILKLSFLKVRIIIRIIVLLFFLLIQYSCTALIIKSVYNNSEWFIKNEVDKFFDITLSQDFVLSDGLEIFLNQHRQNELPLLFDFAETLKQNTFKEGISIKEIYQVTNKFINLRNRLFGSLLNDEFSDFIASIEKEQVKYFEKKISHFRKPYRRDSSKNFKNLSDKENHIRVLEKRKKNIITWFGEITSNQEKLLNEFPLFDRKYFELFFVERNRLVDLLVEQLYKQVLEQSDSESTVIMFKSLFTKPREMVSSEYLAAYDHRSTLVYQLLIDLHQTLTPKQKNYFGKQINFYQKIISDLMESI